MADNQTQPRDPDVVTYEAFKGLRSDVTPERFTPADLSVGDNVDLDKSGRLARRDGYTRQRAGAAHSLWADAQQQICLFASGNQLNQLKADYSATPLATLAGVGYPMSYARVNDRVYFSNGLDTGVLERGAVRSWGLPVPPLPGVTVAVGNLPGGTYQFAVTWLRADGQESGAPLAGTVAVPDGSALAFALPPADPAAVSTVLYLSTPNGEQLYLAAMVSATQRSLVYNDDTLRLNLPLTTQFLGPAPAGQLIAYYRGWLFVALDDVLYVSQPFGYELFDLREYVPLDGRITLLGVMTDKESITRPSSGSGLFVGTDRSCGVLVGGDPHDFQYVPKTDYGAIAGALAYVDGALFGDESAGARALPMWLTTQGICVGLPELAIKNLTRSKYGFAATGQGAALFMSGPNRFIATAGL